MDIPNLLLSRLTVVALLAAQKGAHMLREGFGTVKEVQTKEGRHNLVTEYDHKVEQAIMSTIKAHFSDHTFLAEESGAIGESSGKIQWIIDPLDGTVNFAHEIPVFSVSIAATCQSQVLSSVIINPMLQECFLAEHKMGAYLNGKRLSVTKTATLDKAIAATGFPYNSHENPLNCYGLFTHFGKMGIPVRRLGSAALDLAYLAAGRYDLFWEVSLEPWDYAAGKLLVEEAGGTFSAFDNTPYTTFKAGPVAASNTALHSQLTEHLMEKSGGEKGGGEKP